MMTQSQPKANINNEPKKQPLLQQQRRNHPRWIARCALLGISVAYLMTCPYSKVEESFNLQATHDLFYHGIGPAWQNRGTSSSGSDLEAIIRITTTDRNSNGETAVDTELAAKRLLPYDHLQYPGVVPRTFTGPVWISAILSAVRQLVRMLSFLHLDLAWYPYVVQGLARGVLLLFSLMHWFALADALEERFGHDNNNRNSGHPFIGVYLLTLTACQFHIPFYASRMLPNTFATVLTLRGFTHWVRGGGNHSDKARTSFERMGAAIDLVLATLIFRCDCLLLLFTVGLSWLLTRQLTVLRAIRIGLATAGIGLLLTVPLDSLLWRRLTWPEGEVLFFNTILNKSSDWGVSAWHWYWTNALPKALLGGIVLIPLAVVPLPSLWNCWERAIPLLSTTTNDNKRNQTVPQKRRSGSDVVVGTGNNRMHWMIIPTWLPFLLPALGFVALYSCLGHKEVRFLFPALPLFNMVAAAGLSRLHLAAFPYMSTEKKEPNDKRMTPVVISRCVYALAVLLLMLSALVSISFGAISAWNYPGGDALRMLSQRVQQEVLMNSPSKNESLLIVSVYIDVASAMSGVNLFGQRAAQESTKERVQWSFEKAGYEKEHVLTSDTVDWTQFSHLLCEESELYLDAFDVVAVAQGNPHIDIKRGRVATSDAIYVMERRGWGTRSIATDAEPELI